MEQKIRRDRNMGANLRRLRDQHGISQEKLCVELQRLGCDIARSASSLHSGRYTSVLMMSFLSAWMNEDRRSVALLRSIYVVFG